MMSELFPTFERPAKAISGTSSLILLAPLPTACAGGSLPSFAAAAINLAVRFDRPTPSRLRVRLSNIPTSYIAYLAVTSLISSRFLNTRAVRPAVDAVVAKLYFFILPMIAPSIGSARNLALLLNFPSASPLRVSNNRSIFKPPSGIVDRSGAADPPPSPDVVASPRPPSSSAPPPRAANATRRSRTALARARPPARVHVTTEPFANRKKGVDTADTAVIATTRLTALVVVLLVASRAETHRASPASRPRAPLARPPLASSSLSGRSSTRHFLTISRVVVARPCRRRASRLRARSRDGRARRRSPGARAAPFARSVPRATTTTSRPRPSRPTTARVSNVGARAREPCE